MEKWTLVELKSELKKRGAVLRGKKADLIKRLQAYIRNDNFVQQDKNNVEGELFKMVTPAPASYKDINGSSKLPKVTSQRIELFLQRFGKKLAQGPIDLYEGQYLQCARYAEDNPGLFVTGICRAQMKKVCYNVDIYLNEDGSVAQSQCECAAGVGPYAHCKHVLVLLLALKNVTEEQTLITAEVCTQRLQSFHKPKRPFNGSPVKCNKLPKNQVNSTVYDPRPTRLRNVPEYTQMVTNMCINYAASTQVPSNMPFMQTTSPANPFAIVNDHDYMGSYENCLMNKLKLCNLSKEDRETIEFDTRGQAKSEKWKLARACRLTSSRFKDIICATERRDMQKLVQSIADPQNFVSRATEHGVVNETVALRKFEEMTGNEVIQCGLVVVESHNFLAASPDGLLCDETVVEVKCPYSSRHYEISPTTVPYLQYVDGELQLKNNHAYYYQVMGQLWATKRQFCDFIIYTYKDIKVISIERDQEFIDNMVKPLELFFNNHFFPYLMDKYFYHGYTVGLQ